jgi:hypothetical protein
MTTINISEEDITTDTEILVTAQIRFPASERDDLMVKLEPLMGLMKGLWLTNALSVSLSIQPYEEGEEDDDQLR